MKITPRPQLVSGLESGLGAGMSNFLRGGYRGVTETWNVIQHEVDSIKVDTMKVDTMKVDSMKVDSIKVDSMKATCWKQIGGFKKLSLKECLEYAHTVLRSTAPKDSVSLQGTL